MEVVTITVFHIEYKREYEGIITNISGWKRQKVPEKNIRSTGYVMWKFQYKKKKIPYMSKDFVRRLLRRSQ